MADVDGNGALTIVDAVLYRRSLFERRGGRVTRTLANRYGANGIYYGVVIDDPLLNGHPDARLVAAHRFVSGFNPTIGVWYHPSLNRWIIFNEDRSPMLNGEVFHYTFGSTVRAFPTSGDFSTFLDGYDTSAILLATHCYQAAYNPSPIGIGFENPPRWYAYNEDYTNQVAGERLFVANAGDHGGVIFHTAANDYHGYGAYLDDLRLNNNPDAIVLAGHGYYRASNPSAIGVWYDEAAGLWLAFNETGDPIPMGEAIQYLIAGP